MEDLSRARELRVDKFSVQKLRENSYTAAHQDIESIYKQTEKYKFLKVDTSEVV